MKWVPVRLAFVASPKPCLYALAGDGTVGLGYGSYAEEHIDRSDHGPTGRGPLRDLRLIGATLFAAGMSRQVYRRTSSGQWSRCDQGVVAPLGETTLCGFTSIDGLSEDRIWAVGYFGEIWSFHDGSWRQQESPTNAILHRVKAVQKNMVLACGQKGVILTFRGEQWAELAHIDGEDHLWGLECFKDLFYIASEKALYRLTIDGSVDRVSVDGVTSFGHLHANDGVLWSFGTKDLAWTADGSTWSRVSPVL
jgi:hypothetical protein